MKMTDQSDRLKLCDEISSIYFSPYLKFIAEFKLCKDKGLFTEQMSPILYFYWTIFKVADSLASGRDTTSQLSSRPTSPGVNEI